jgi:hypothetical protein
MVSAISIFVIKIFKTGIITHQGKKIFKNDLLIVQKILNASADSLQILDTFENFNSLTAEIYQDKKLIFTRNFK